MSVKPDDVNRAITIALDYLDEIDSDSLPALLNKIVDEMPNFVDIEGLIVEMIDTGYMHIELENQEITPVWIYGRKSYPSVVHSIDLSGETYSCADNLKPAIVSITPIGRKRLKS